MITIRYYDSKHKAFVEESGRTQAELDAIYIRAYNAERSGEDRLLPSAAIVFIFMTVAIAVLAVLKSWGVM